ncbi:hypothetical protein RRG08_065566 [Elysia crispata]|uniref:Uncharacterized protein n=1 Tax=Elysia crispata TaxID=231223 RepID=A0AAE1ARI5_9GAST|nr:hypothetical protein RRG08_065566 [Elysia crispata]
MKSGLELVDFLQFLNTLDWENFASTSGAKRPRFLSDQVRSLLLEYEEEDQPMNHPESDLQSISDVSEEDKNRSRSSEFQDDVEGDSDLDLDEPGPSGDGEIICIKRGVLPAGIKNSNIGAKVSRNVIMISVSII